MVRKAALRKCKYCQKEINIESKKDWLKYKKRYMHIECFISAQLNRGLEMNNIKIKIQEIQDEMKEEQDKKAKKIKEINQIKKNNKRNEENEIEYKNQFIKYLQDTYNVNLTNRYFYIKLAQINNGTYKGLREGISYEDLLFMFKKKQRELNIIAQNKVKKGNRFNTQLSRIYFDLAVIVNKYDGFKKWKEKQKLLNVTNEIEQNKNINKIDYSQFNKNINNNINNSAEVEINSIIDDI